MARATSTPLTGPSARDRKSTRLNSSHGSISYAVFCLKKKKKQQNGMEKMVINTEENKSACMKVYRRRNTYEWDDYKKVDRRNTIHIQQHIQPQLRRTE